MSDDTRPADAALLRDIANACLDDAADRGDGIRAVGMTENAAHRLRALAEIMDGEKWTERLTTLARCYGQRSAIDQEGAADRVCDQQECARCWREKARRIATDRQELWEQVGALERQCCDMESECERLASELADLRSAAPVDGGRE